MVHSQAVVTPHKKKKKTAASSKSSLYIKPAHLPPAGDEGKSLNKHDRTSLNQHPAGADVRDNNRSEWQTEKTCHVFSSTCYKHIVLIYDKTKQMKSSVRLWESVERTQSSELSEGLRFFEDMFSSDPVLTLRPRLTRVLRTGEKAVKRFSAVTQGQLLSTGENLKFWIFCCWNVSFFPHSDSKC